MSEIEAFLDRQHSLNKRSKINYRFAIKKFESLTGKKFEDTYLDQKKVHKFLNLLSENLSPSAWNTYVTLYKRYAKFLNDPEDEVCPKFWVKVKKKKIDWEEKLKNKWLTKKEFYKLLDVVDYPRDKAMYGVTVEGALRSGELLGLKIRDVHKTSYGYDVTVSGKTGTSSFPVVLFAPLLTQWLNQHPFKQDSNAPLWPRRLSGKAGGRYDGIQETGAYEAIKRYSKLAGLSSKMSLHWLRHTKITWTAKDKNVRVSDEMAKKMFRWGKSSNMFSRYTHLHGVDSKDTFLALAGVKEIEEEETDSVLDPKKCLNCQEMNSAEFLYCSKCGFVLDEEEARKQVEQKKLNDAFILLSLERLKMDKELAEYKKKQEKKT